MLVSDIFNLLPSVGICSIHHLELENLYESLVLISRGEVHTFSIHISFSLLFSFLEKISRKKLLSLYALEKDSSFS